MYTDLPFLFFMMLLKSKLYIFKHITLLKDCIIFKYSDFFFFLSLKQHVMVEIENSYF